MSRRIIQMNFWPPSFYGGDSVLYADQLGWEDSYKAEAHTTDTYKIYHAFVYRQNFDIILYLPAHNEFLYFDMEYGGVYQMPTRDGWDGKYTFDSVDMDMNRSPDFNPDYIFEFSDAIQLWKEFRLYGHDLKYIIEHSVVWLNH